MIFASETLMDFCETFPLLFIYIATFFICQQFFFSAGKAFPCRTKKPFLRTPKRYWRISNVEKLLKYHFRRSKIKTENLEKRLCRNIFQRVLMAQFTQNLQEDGKKIVYASFNRKKQVVYNMYMSRKRVRRVVYKLYIFYQ